MNLHYSDYTMDGWILFWVLISLLLLCLGLLIICGQASSMAVLFGMMCLLLAANFRKIEDILREAKSVTVESV